MNSALPADAAFSLNAIIELPETIVLIWDIQEGYYLYRKSLNIIRSDEDITHLAEIPAGKQITDEFFGEVEVYYDRLLVRLPFDGNATADIKLELTYQGCAEIGYCYPMQHKLIELSIP